MRYALIEGGIMPFYLAMSALQGKDQIEAYNQLISLNPDGFQLTPGNKINKSFKDTISVPYTLHHCYSWDKLRVELYDFDGNLRVHIEDNQSIHPPIPGKYTKSFRYWLDNVAADHIIENMYPGYFLGNDEELNALMDKNQRMAIDVSHLYICMFQKSISEKTLQRILNYQNIKEVHISQNDGRSDSHRYVTHNMPFADWAKERAKDGITIVFESYFHRLNQSERLEQMELARTLVGLQ